MFGAFTPIRILGFSFWVFYLLKPTLYKDIRSLQKAFFFVLIYSVISILWVLNLRAYIIDFLILFCSIGCFLLIYYASKKAINPINSIFKGWILFTILNLSISIWEISTGNHLHAGSFQSENYAVGISGVVSLRAYSAVTYGNYNSLSIVLCLCFFMLILSIAKIENFRSRILCLSLILLIIFVEIVNTSRGCLLTLLLALYPLWVSLKRQKNNRYLIILIVIVIVTHLWMEYSNAILFLIDRKLSARSHNIYDDPRYLIMTDGLEISMNSFFLGGGPGSQISEYKKYGTFIPYAHNMWLQTLIEYGLIITILLIYSIGKLAIKTFRSSDSLTHLIGLILLFSWPVLTIVDEGYMKVFHWVFFASILSIFHTRNYQIKYKR